MIISHTFHAETPGPKLLVLGAVHGDETCGPTAIRRVLAEFDSGTLTLERGSATFVPVCNPEAYRRGVRFVERNLNRYLVPTENPSTYEARLGNILCPMIEQCDVLLDLHSLTAGGKPFMFLGPDNPEEMAFAASLGPDTYLNGWDDAFRLTGRNPSTDPDESTGTSQYARRHGAISVTIECGQHKAPKAAEIAYKGIHNALLYLGLVTGRTNMQSRPLRHVIVKQVVYRDDEGDFVKPWKNLETIRAGEVIAIDVSGRIYTADADSVIIMPRNTPIGSEWYYLGVEAPL